MNLFMLHIGICLLLAQAVVLTIVDNRILHIVFYFYFALHDVLFLLILWFPYVSFHPISFFFFPSYILLLPVPCPSSSVSSPSSSHLMLCMLTKTPQILYIINLASKLILAIRLVLQLDMDPSLAMHLAFFVDMQNLDMDVAWEMHRVMEMEDLDLEMGIVRWEFAR
jgi:hypothetical protein